jgi:hypothetical protein
MGLYKYVSSEVLKHILDGSVRFTQLGAFNDPFELLVRVVRPVGDPGGQISFSFDLTGPRTGVARQLVNDSAAEVSTWDTPARQIRQALDDAVGALCLTRNPDSLVMWAHYADAYTGAVVEFDEGHEFFEGLVDVQYCKSRLAVHIDEVRLPRTLSLADVTNKPDEWGYEREVRLYRPLRDCAVTGSVGGFPLMTMTLPPECLKSVSFGERMERSELARHWATLQRMPHVGVAQAVVREDEYGIRSEPIRIPGLGSPMISPRNAWMFIEEPDPIGAIARYQAARANWKSIVSQRA